VHVAGAVEDLADLDSTTEQIVAGCGWCHERPLPIARMTGVEAIQTREKPFTRISKTPARTRVGSADSGSADKKRDSRFAEDLGAAGGAAALAPPPPILGVSCLFAIS
jgi:hypothetical protein